MLRNQQSILDIIDSINLIFEYTQNIDWNEIETKDQDAVIRRLIIIGEATKRLSVDFRADHSEVPWRQIAGLRDIIVHEYDDIRLDIIRDVVEIELPQILPILQIIVDRILRLSNSNSPQLNSLERKRLHVACFLTFSHFFKQDNPQISRQFCSPNE